MKWINVFGGVACSVLIFLGSRQSLLKPHPGPPPIVNDEPLIAGDGLCCGDSHRASGQRNRTGRPKGVGRGARRHRQGCVLNAVHRGPLRGPRAIHLVEAKLGIVQDVAGRGFPHRDYA